ncbi:THAP domain-containing protein 1-like [Schistocerca piceifrons]|uniref:THAP domain-containing protein 1-like n=1 Tax=Schistocerca piceifrons TaxID=274613 RepID=UPI001F5EB750|nr:THAP domain-containing protein 1-like [Schistocerca piceifrons]
MVRSCAAFNCNSKNGSKEEDGNNVAFHRFSLTNDFLHQKWIVATRRENFQPTANHLLCSLHFEENCNMENYVNRRQLKDDATPKVFAFPTHLKKVTKARKLPKPRNAETAENMCVDVHVSGYIGDHIIHFHRVQTKLNTVNKNCKRQMQKICKLANILEELTAKNLVNNKVISLINATHSDMLLEILDRSKNRSQQYSDRLKAFAITLNFYSPAAYRYVRSTFNLSLPHVSTLRRWYNCIEGLPGFTSESFDIIKARIAKSSREVFCVLMFDKMSMKKCVE